MGWKWDAARKYAVQITVTPASVDESVLDIVWGDLTPHTEIVKNADAKQLLHSLAQQLQQLGYMM